MEVRVLSHHILKCAVAFYTNPLNILNPPSSQRVRGTFNKRAARHIQSPFFLLLLLLSPQIVASLLNRCAL